MVRHQHFAQHQVIFLLQSYIEQLVAFLVEDLHVVLFLQVGQNPLHQIVLLEQDELNEEWVLTFIKLIAQQLMKLSHLL